VPVKPPAPKPPAPKPAAAPKSLPPPPVSTVAVPSPTSVAPAAPRAKRSVHTLVPTASTPWAAAVVECDAVVTSTYGSTCAQMLRVIDHMNDDYDPQYVRCLDGPVTSLTISIRPACDGTQMVTVPDKVLLVLHCRKRQMHCMT